MRILKNPALTSTVSLNCIAINADKTYLAIGDINKIITVFRYPKIENSIKNNLPFSNQEKIVLKQHDDTVNCLLFTNTNMNYLFSGSSDKNIIVWKIEDNLSYEIIRIIKSNSDVLDISLTNNDEFFLTCCVDNKIYLWKNGITNSQFICLREMSIHTNFVTSIIIDPMSKANIIRFASFSDESRLILSEINLEDPNYNYTNIYDYKEYMNSIIKNSSFYKKIDWSCDGNWIVSVNHQYIKNHRLAHARIFNKSDLSKSMVLVGFESDVLIAKFSKALYNDSNGRKFSILATTDRNGGLILWRVFQSTFKQICNIKNFSEALITHILWSPDGEFLFTLNTNGCIIIIQINDFTKSKIESNSIIRNHLDSSFNPHVPINVLKTNSRSSQIIDLETPSVKRIQPIPIANKESINLTNNNFGSSFLSRKTQPQNDLSNLIESVSFGAMNSNLNFPQSPFMQGPIMPVQELNNLEYKTAFKTLIKQKMENESLNKIIYLKLENFNNINIYIQGINKILENYYVFRFLIEDKILYSFKTDKCLIKHLFANNFFIAIYDNQNILTCFTLFNTLIFTNIFIENITIMTGFKEYLLIITSGNKMKIFNVFTKKIYLETKVNISNMVNEDLLGNYASNKIKNIRFLDLNKIILSIENKGENYFLYDQRMNELILLDNMNEAENLIISLTQNIKQIKSDYNFFFNETVFSTIRLYNEFEDCIEDVIKNNYELRAIEEKMNFHLIIEKKKEWQFMFRQMIDLLIKYKFFYRLIDFINFYMKYEDLTSIFDKSYFETFVRETINFHRNSIPCELKRLIDNQNFNI